MLVKRVKMLLDNSKNWLGTEEVPIDITLSGKPRKVMVLCP
ncbi:MAG: hypothetical protein PUB66_03275 [Oscillospiraceae bacterium]|nr:hypothetical protein [Oscillospiraceae bacterium]